MMRIEKDKCEKKEVIRERGRRRILRVYLLPSLFPFPFWQSRTQGRISEINKRKPFNLTPARRR